MAHVIEGSHFGLGLLLEVQLLTFNFDISSTRLVLDIRFGPTLGGDLGDVHFLVLNLNLSRRTESKYPQREDTGHGCIQPP